MEFYQKKENQMAPRKLKIGFIGNFIPPYSTENDRLWSFLKLGHDVFAFQENQTTVEDLKDFVFENPEPALDLLVYSHTHDPSYNIVGLKEFFGLCKQMGVPTVSVHLDKWQGLGRVTDIGQEATWFTEYLFMADFSPEAQALYKQHNLNVHYLKAGVVERDCYMAAPDPVRFPHEIVFVGSKGYHPEYPFRPQLIEFLQKTYQHRFGHWGNDGLGVVRGHDLNVLYASAKIAVGDSCFAGQENYVSDRYYETRGRGGLLVHPFVKGVDSVGLIGYKSGDLQDLKKCIDALIQTGVSTDFRKRGFEWVKDHETYTHRAQEMLEVIYG